MAAARDADGIGLTWLLQRAEAIRPAVTAPAMAWVAEGAALRRAARVAARAAMTAGWRAAACMARSNEGMAGLRKTKEKKRSKKEPAPRKLDLTNVELQRTSLQANEQHTWRRKQDWSLWCSCKCMRRRLLINETRRGMSQNRLLHALPTRRTSGSLSPSIDPSASNRV